jgi:hypothetical protein
VYLHKLGDYYLSRRSIVVKDHQENVNLRDNARDGSGTEGCTNGGEGGGCVTPVRSKEIIFTLEFHGNGDIRAADSLYQSFNANLGDICRADPQEYQYRVCDEDIQVETIVQGYMRRINMDKEFYGIKTGEVHLTTRDIDDEPEALVLAINWIPPSITP